MAAVKGPNVINSGLVLALDAANPQSFRGIPTDNLLVNSGMSTYNNVGGDVTSVLVSTGETYRGATVFKQTLTATSANGVSWLSNGNNPGIGVVTSGGGGVANRYTGHSIFFRTTVPMHSSPIFNHYSNIGGWQSCCNFDDMGDGWFRAHVIWFNTVNGNDGKYWAINPLSSTLNVPIEIFWAGPFKEDRNDSAVVSPFINGTRGTTVATGGGWADQSGNSRHGELVNGPGFNSSNFGSLVFDGIDDFVTIPNITMGNGNLAWTISAWTKTATTVNGLGLGSIISNASGGPVYSMLGVNNGKIVYWTYQNDTWSQKLGIGTVNNNEWHLLTWVNNTNSTMTMYVDGNLDTTVANSTSGNNNPLDRVGGSWTGRYNGFISNLLIYQNRALSATEVQRNYNATRRRYGL